MTSRLPTGMRPYISGAPQLGRVEEIVVRPSRRAAARSVGHWDVSDAKVDHARSAKRAVTLIQHEHLEVIGRILGRPVLATELRRNVVVSGINLLPLRHGFLEVGEVILRGTVPCDPCSRMQEVLGPGGFAAMWGHGGICAAIVRPGVIRVGDEVRYIDPESDEQLSI